MISGVREFRERKKAKVKNDTRKERCEVRIDSMDDDDGREGRGTKGGVWERDLNAQT